MNPAWADLASEARIVGAVTGWGLLAAFLIVFAAVVAFWAATRRSHRHDSTLIEEIPGQPTMPGHPERIRFLDDPVEDEIFGDLAEQLLDEGLARICEDAGWMQ